MTRPASFAFASVVVGAGLALFAGSAPAVAQDATYLPETASHCDVFRGLSKVIPGYCADPDEHEFAGELGHTSTTRSIRVHAETAAPATPVSVAAPSDTAPAQSPTPAASAAATPSEVVEVAAVEQAEPPKKLSIAMRIQFEYDSFRLSEDAKQMLDRVASVLKDDLMRDKVVEIAGHADAHGPDDYNLQLSQQRARSVRAYLIEQHDLAPGRLPYAGKGESQPYDPSDPYAGVNRRVEFRNITG